MLLTGEIIIQWQTVCNSMHTQRNDYCALVRSLTRPPFKSQTIIIIVHKSSDAHPKKQVKI